MESWSNIFRSTELKALVLLIVDIYFGYFFTKLLIDTKKHSKDSYIGIVVISYMMMGILNIFSLLFVISILA